MEKEFDKKVFFKEILCIIFSPIIVPYCLLLYLWAFVKGGLNAVSQESD